MEFETQRGLKHLARKCVKRFTVSPRLGGFPGTTFPLAEWTLDLQRPPQRTKNIFRMYTASETPKQNKEDILHTPEIAGEGRTPIDVLAV